MATFIALQHVLHSIAEQLEAGGVRPDTRTAEELGAVEV